MSSRMIAAACVAMAVAFSTPANAGEVAPGGTGIVEAKSVKDGTVTIGGSVYRVAATTRILDKSGRPIPLAALPVAQSRRDDGSVDVSAAVNFEATEAGSGWVLDQIRVVGELPR